MEPTKYKIHIVEDSKIIAEILKKIATSIPEIDAWYFLTGEEMLKEFHANPPDMVLLDYYLSTKKEKISEDGTAMNGDDIFKEIKNTHPEIPVVLITGMSDQQKIEELKNMGFYSVIHKNEDDIYSSVLNSINRFLLTHS